MQHALKGRVTRIAEGAYEALSACSYASFLLDELLPVDGSSGPAADPEQSGWYVYLQGQWCDNAVVLRDSLLRMASDLDDIKALNELRLATDEPAQFGKASPELSYAECAAMLVVRAALLAHRITAFQDAAMGFGDCLSRMAAVRSGKMQNSLEVWQNVITSDQLAKPVAMLLQRSVGPQLSFDVPLMQVAKECQRATGEVPPFVCADGQGPAAVESRRLLDTTRRAIELLKSGATPDQVGFRLGLSANNVSKIKGRYVTDS